jgi:hypothetical protein
MRTASTLSCKNPKRTSTSRNHIWCWPGDVVRSCYIRCHGEEFIILIRRTAAVTVMLIGIAGAVGVPVASAAPVPGGDCGPSGPMVSPDGTLSCDMQLGGVWLTNNIGKAALGQPCLGHLGAVNIGGPGEGDYVAECTTGAGGPVWTRWKRANH